MLMSPRTIARFPIITHTLVIVALVASAGACKKSEPEAKKSDVSAKKSPASGEVKKAGVVSDPPAKADDSAAKEREAARLAELEKRRLAKTVNFATDSAALSEASRRALDEKLVVLNKNPKLRIEVLGHCDERGTEAHNFQLGLARARAAKKYLVSRGIAEDRVDVRSLGESNPLLTGSGELALAKNRRNEFVVVR